MAAFLKKKSASPPDMSRLVMDGLTPEEVKKAESVANMKKIQEIEAAWPTGSQPLLRPGRLFVHESGLDKMCRKGLKARYFWLFNDVLMYGTGITKTKYKSQVIMKLQDISVQGVEDSAEGSNGMQINDKRKSFLVYCGSPQEKVYWLKTLKRFIKLSREAAGMDGDNDLVDSRAVWVPDIKVKVCMVCNVTAFSLRLRKHHCRNCGKVVCGPCSGFKAVLNQSKPERVCRNCHGKLGGSDPADVPILGSASTENAAAKTKRKVNEGGGMSSDEYTSSEDDEDDDAAIGAGPAAAAPLDAAAAAAEALLPPEEDMQPVDPIIQDVKEGKITMDDAVARMAAKDWVERKRSESQTEGSANPSAEYTETPAASSAVPDGPYALALYDNDDPEHPDEIAFMTGTVLCLTKKLDDEWMEGYLFGVEPKKVGIFPAAFVDVKVMP